MYSRSSTSFQSFRLHLSFIDFFRLVHVFSQVHGHIVDVLRQDQGFASSLVCAAEPPNSKPETKGPRLNELTELLPVLVPVLFLYFTLHFVDSLANYKVWFVRG
jgi:hypothetical protein